MIRGRKEGDNFASWFLTFDGGFDPIIPAPIQFGPSVKPPLKDINSNHDSKSESKEPAEKDGPKKEVADIYKEAFENAKCAEEKKFHGRFDSLMVELRNSLETLLQNGVNHSYSNTPYGDVMMNYRGKLKDLLVSLSQRLEIVIESFDSSAEDSLETSHKVRQMISRLVTENFKEPLDLGSDEAVSDLSSLSEESSDPVKSFEDQLAHAIVSKVLENHRRDHHLDFCIDELDGRKDEVDHARNSSLSEERSDIDKPYDSESLTSDNEKCDTVYSNSTAKNSRTSKLTTNQNSSFHSRGHDASIQCETSYNQKDSSVQERPASVNEMVQCELTESQRDSIERPRPISVNETVQCDIQTETVRKSIITKDEMCETDDFEKCESVKSFSSSSTNVENEFEKLRSFAMDISTRNQPQSRQVEEYLDELPIEEEKVDRDESRQEFASRYDTFDRVHDDTRVSLPSLDDFDYDYESAEVDPDLLSMNLAPIMEEDEEEEEVDGADDQGAVNNGDDNGWKGNWIFKSPVGITPYKNVGDPSKKTESLGQVYMTIPQPNKHMSPKIGHSETEARKRDVDQMSDLSDTTDKDGEYSDEESSYYEHTSAELSRIGRKHGKQRLRSSSMQTDDSDDNVDGHNKSLSRSRSSVNESADESVSSSKKKLIEEYVPADGNDPKFTIPPESLEVPEGEPAKFMLQVSGTEPINVFWYRVEEDLVELMNSEQYETSRDGNKSYLTIFNPVHADAGQYMAIAINEKGQCCQYLILTVKKNKQELKKPEFLKGIQDVDATEGQSVKFRCKVKGYPQPRINWYKDGKLLMNDDSYKIEKFGNRDYILSIDFASMNDDAEYTVVAKNIAGEAKSVAQLIVDTDEVRPSQPIPKLPKPSMRKDEQDLTNLNRKMYETKENVTSMAEQILDTANELTDIHKSLDEVDHLLTSFEHDLDPCSTSDVTNNNWADTMLSHNLCHNTILNYQRMKTAAENVRKTTSRAMDLVGSTDTMVEDKKMECLATSTPRSSEEVTPRSKVTSLENKPKWLQFVKEDGDIPAENLVSKDSDSKDSYFNQPIKTTDLGYAPLSIDTSDHVTPVTSSVVEITPKQPSPKISHSQLDNVHLSVANDNTDHVTQPETLDTSLDSSNISSDLNDNVLDSDPQIVNFGAKPVQAEFYSRDYIINNSSAPAKPPRKKWEVKTDPYSPRAEIVNRQNNLDNTEEKIYMSASTISNLESKIQHLQREVSDTPSSDKRKISELEEDIAQTVAQTYRSEHDIGAIERSVEALQVSCPASPRSAEDEMYSNMSSPSLSIDSGFSSIRERPQPTVMIGTTAEDDLPESRTELNEESGVELPSVNKLKQLFGGSGGDDSSFHRKSSFDNPVHSITARSLGKDKVEKIRTMARGGNQPSPLASESSNQNTGKSQLTVNLAPVSHTKINEPQPTQIFPKNKGEYFPSDQPIKKDQTKLVESQPIKMPAKSQKTSKAPPTPTATSDKNAESSEKKKSGSRIRAGCINARAKFWEKKIQGDAPTAEDEFPSMIEQVPDKE